MVATLQVRDAMCRVTPASGMCAVLINTQRGLRNATARESTVTNPTRLYVANVGPFPVSCDGVERINVSIVTSMRACVYS